MANRTTGDPPEVTGLGPAQIFQFAKERADAMLKIQKELLDEYEKASHAWLARVKSEVDLWSDLATKVAASHSIPEGLETYRSCVSQRVQMAVEDGQRLFDETQKMIATITKSFNGQAKETKE